MKRLFSILFVLLIVAGITGCKNTEDDVLHLGLNAIIVEIDHEKQLIYVSDTEHEDVFGGRAAIDCSKAIERDCRGRSTSRTGSPEGRHGRRRRAESWSGR